MSIVNDDLAANALNVPDRLPIILKQFCKAAIKTQPYDLLKWSCAYFHALAEGVEPPTKIRIEYPLPRRPSSLTFGLVKVLLRQFGDYNKSLPLDAIRKRWDDLCLDLHDLNLILVIGRFRRKCPIKKFLAIAVGLLGANLFDTMLMICELFTMEPDGGSATIPLSLFTETYEYLARLRCDGEKRDQSDDASDFIIKDSRNLNRFESEHSNKNLAEEISDSTNLDTEDDANLDPDSLSRDESSSTQQKLFRNEHENVTENNAKMMQTDENSSESTKTLIDSDSIILTSEDPYGNKRKGHESKRNLTFDPKWLSHYPLVPGIGPRLTVEEITAVIEWVTECANVQEGMIGPRNLRHFQCPPLDRQNQD